MAIVRRLRELQIQVGIAINPETHIDKHLLFVVQKTNPDLVLVMTVQPGKGGQKMLEDCIEKVRVLNNQMPDLSIQVDGGINEENAKLVIDAGASILVAGTLLFNSKEPKAIISRIKNFVDKD